MAGADGGGSAAGDSLAAPAPDSDGSKTVTVPSDALPDAKPGDVYTVKAVADGNVTLECKSAEGEDDWGNGLAESAPRGEEGAM